MNLIETKEDRTFLRLVVANYHVKKLELRISELESGEEIRRLKNEIGVLESKKEELKYQLANSHKDLNLQIKLLKDRNTSKSLIKELKNSEVQKENEELRKQIKQLKKSNSELIIKLLKYENK